MRLTFFLFALCLAFSLNGQKKVMDQDAYAIWKTIGSVQISNDGKWVKYHLVPGKGDATLIVYDTERGEEFSFERVKTSIVTYDNKHLIFSIEPALDTITALRRKKVNKKDFPKDSLIILDLNTMDRDTFPNISNFKVPEKWSGQIAFQASVTINNQDTIKNSKPKVEEKFFRYNLKEKILDTFPKVDEYLFAESQPRLVFMRSGKDSIEFPGVYILDANALSSQSIFSTPGKYKKIAMDKQGDQLGFLVDRDTTDRRIRPYELGYWKFPENSASIIVGARQKLTEEDWFLSENSQIRFSESGSRMFFGIAPNPILPDSLALEEEMVSVEVWTTNDPMLYTMQEVQERRLKNKTYEIVYDIDKGKFLSLETILYPEGRNSVRGEGKFALAVSAEPYLKELTWTGNSRKDIYIINLETGESWLMAKGVDANPDFSPSGKYVYWYDPVGEAWMIYDPAQRSTGNLTRDLGVSISDELNDSPTEPGSYGTAGWTEGDEHFLIYDRYDIWKLDPKGSEPPVNLTNRRDEKISCRIIKLDGDLDYVPEENIFRFFNEIDKSSGYGKLNLETKAIQIIEQGPFNYSRRMYKAKQSDALLFTKESFQVFPDLVLSDLMLSNQKVISNANPQQNDYAWGSIELFEWTDFKGEQVQGLLVKPEDFDPAKKYPLIVNFYERSSDGLFNHRAPEPHRSTINYTYYANKGYLIFNPDVKYEIGYPGNSCYNAVVSGVEALSKNEYVDKEKIGVQGHSWGGYQIAYLLNKTGNLFRCAEAGAPVVNMISAYGGIRWASGMSRMFQYERTQTRLGKSLWESPDLYFENSPIFELEKTETPVLILHNDNDGAVPWYQGIEYYMALRRLDKPAWFLNYNGEPHWPLKWENRLDFNKRMEQFFAYYLLDEPMPLWMKEGVPAIEKGINQRFELIEKEE